MSCDKIIFDSEKVTAEATFPLANGYISETNICFEKEGVTALITAEGAVTFHRDEQPMTTAQLPSVDSGKQVYDQVLCRVENNRIHLRFPIYQWVDHYPNCDGEHDRWSTKTVGYHTLTFDCATNTVLE